MITIFHGNNQIDSRASFLKFVDQSDYQEILKLDSKNIDPDKLNNFVNSGSLFPGKKIIAISNFFSSPKPTQTKIISSLTKSNIDIALWQDKALTAIQLKTFTQAKIFFFKANDQIFACLNAIKSKNLASFSILFNQVVSTGFFDLFFYLLKNSFRRQIQTNSKFNQNILKKIYLQLIELEFQFKTGQLLLPREMALLRVLTPLLK